MEDLNLFTLHCTLVKNAYTKRVYSSLRTCPNMILHTIL